MNPSENAIQSAIDRLKRAPGAFQRLSERYAELLYPQRFKNLIPSGRNSEDVPVKGWPDSYVSLPDGRIDAIEATLSRDWGRHLRSDLQKVETFGTGCVAGFLFVAWAPSPPAELLQRYRDRFVKLGIPSEKVTFVFRQQLVRDLKLPRFAGLWVELLRLRSDCYPFATISNARVFGSESEGSAFAPTRNEYIKGQVHHPSLAKDVKQYLDTQNWAFVRGLGAAGKTVLAVDIGLEHELTKGSVYYLDLGVWSEKEAGDILVTAFEVLTTRADYSVLFILDNVHLNEELTRSLFDHWRVSPCGSQMLIVGRWVSVSPDSRGVARPLDELEQTALVLKVEPEDLAGVYIRLARKSTSQTDDITRPPDEVLMEWYKLFGGDLVAFSAAVVRRIDQLMKGNWCLTGDDAADYIRERYLEPIGIEERRNLLVLAALAKFEISAPLDVLDGPVKELLRIGLVQRFELGKGKRVYFRLIHPGVGILLMTATGLSEHSLTMLIDSAHRSPICGSAIVTRLYTLGADEELRATLASFLDSPMGILGIMGPGLQNIRFITKNLSRLRILTESEMDQSLVERSVSMLSALLDTRPDFLPAILKHIETKLPRTNVVISTALEVHDYQEKLTQASLLLPLANLTRVLKYFKGCHNGIYESLLTALSTHESVRMLEEAALQVHLHILAGFLMCTERELSEVHAKISASLANRDNRRTLAENAMQSPLTGLVFFLKYAEHNLPEEVYQTITDVITDPRELSSLSATASHTSLAGIRHFFNYANDKLPGLSQNLAIQLSEPDLVKRLAEAAYQSPLNDLLFFLRGTPLAKELVSAIEQDSWMRAISLNQTILPDMLPSLAHIFEQLGRPELAEAPACVLLSNPEPYLWNRQGIGLRNVTYALRLGRSVGNKIILRFLDTIVTPSWLEAQYSAASSGTIAASLFALGGWQDEQVISRFLTDSLQSRVKNELDRMEVCDYKELSGTLQLLGSTGLVGLIRSTLPLKWPDDNQLRETIEFATPCPNMNEIGHIQMQLWLGLREMARLRPDKVRVPYESGEYILGLWKLARGRTSRHIELNTQMIEWLSRCMQVGWELVPE